MTTADANAFLTGPIPTLRTPFTREGVIDEESLRNLIDFIIEANANVLVLTVGDSHYEILSDEEILALTRLVLEQVNGRVPVVVADRRFSTRQAVVFARDCRRLGASMIMVLPPDWGSSITPASLAAHYARIARELPVMLVTNFLIPRGPSVGMEFVSQALAASDQILAIKDDMGGRFAQQLCAEYGERCAIWAGGRKQNHLLMAPFGARGYLSTFLTFKPEIAHRYWAAWSGGKLGEAISIIRDIDMPFFDLLMKSPGGFDAAIHGIMEIYGLAERWRPGPYYSLNDEEMGVLKDNLAQLGL